MLRILGLILVLTGCGSYPVYEWDHPLDDNVSLDVDKSECIIEAIANVQPNWTCWQSWNYGSSCTSTGTSEDRHEYIYHCLVSKSWQSEPAHEH